MNFKIGKLSKIFGVTNEALRYYEKNGLIEPKRAINGYRYFDELDIQKIGTIKKLRNANFSLEEIKKTYDGATEAELYEIYISKLELIKKEIYFKQNILNTIEENIKLIHEKENLSINFKIENCDEYYRFNFTDIDNLLSNELITDKISNWFDNMMLVNASTSIPISTLLGHTKIISRGLIIKKDIAENIGLNLSKPIDHIKSQLCVSYIMKTYLHEDNTDLIFKEALQFIKENKLEIVNDAFTSFITSFRDDSGKIINYKNLFIPVKYMCFLGYTTYLKQIILQVIEALSWL